MVDTKRKQEARIHELVKQVSQKKKWLMAGGLVAVLPATIRAMASPETRLLGFAGIGGAATLFGLSLQLRETLWNVKTELRHTKASGHEIERLKELIAAESSVPELEQLREEIVSTNQRISSLEAVQKGREEDAVKQFEKVMRELASSNASEIVNSLRAFAVNYSGLSLALVPVFSQFVDDRPSRSVLFIGPSDECDGVSTFASNYPDLQIETVSLTEPTVKADLTRFETIIIWLPQETDLPAVVPFSWISTSDEVLIGPSAHVTRRRLESLTHGTPVRFFVKKDFGNFLQVDVGRSLES